MGENGPRVDNSTEPQIETLTLRGLNLPGEASNTERNREVAMDVTGLVVSEVVQAVVENKTGIALGPVAGTASLVLSPTETGMGASPAARDQARSEMEQKQAKQAVINWFNELVNQNQ